MFEEIIPKYGLEIHGLVRRATLEDAGKWHDLVATLEPLSLEQTQLENKKRAQKLLDNY